jgi:hypothetical protein
VKTIQKEFTIDGILYITDECGVVHQHPPDITMTYDRDYVASRYDVIPDKVREMSMLRIGWLVGEIQRFSSILDVGYGNGDFLKAWALWPNWEMRRYGADISGYPLPDGCVSIDLTNVDEIQLTKDIDVVTFFDSLEHIPDLSFMRHIQSQWIALTVPWFPGQECFANWKHRRPGEHLHHFTPHSLSLFMFNYGYYSQTFQQSLEDGLRPPCDGYTKNTFTALYKRSRR